MSTVFYYANERNFVFLHDESMYVRKINLYHQYTCAIYITYLKY